MRIVSTCDCESDQRVVVSVLTSRNAFFEQGVDVTSRPKRSSREQSHAADKCRRCLEQVL